LIDPVKALAEQQDEKSFQFFINPVASSEEAHLEIYLRNVGEKILEFEAPTSQWYDFTVRDPFDKIVYSYSKGKSFLQAFQKMILKPGESKLWMEKIKLPGKSLNVGNYKIEAKLLVATINGESVKGYHILMDQAEMVVPPKNPIIKSVMINKNEGIHVVSGKARLNSGELFYVVEDGHNEWIPETKIKLESKHSQWGDFSFVLNIPKEKYHASLTLILYLYEKDEEGTINHSYSKIIK
jgi:hypothetical protein